MCVIRAAVVLRAQTRQGIAHTKQIILFHFESPQATFSTPSVTTTPNHRAEAQEASASLAAKEVAVIGASGVSSVKNRATAVNDSGPSPSAVAAEEEERAFQALRAQVREQEQGKCCFVLF